MRLYLVNTANTRLFDFAVRGARMKLVGGDSGRYERETFIEEVLLATQEPTLEPGFVVLPALAGALVR